MSFSRHFLVFKVSPAISSAIRLLLGLFVVISPSLAQTTAQPPTLADVRAKYLGAQVHISGMLVPPSAGRLYHYGNWRWAKKRPNGRYVPETETAWGLLGYGYERHPATVIAIQLSAKQDDKPWVDMLGNHHPAGELGPDFDFIVRFDGENGGTAMCTSHLETVDFDLAVVSPKPAAPK